MRYKAVSSISRASARCGAEAPEQGGRARRRVPVRPVALALLCACASLLAPAVASASGSASRRLALHKPSLRSSKTATYRWACPRGACDTIVVSPKKAATAGAQIYDGSGERKGLDPQDLRSAYSIPSTLESPQTIALIDAFGYPDAESDLATYRERYGLPPCTKSNGCFAKVNQSGKEGDYPEEEEGWDLEAALDEDMASAACPQCHILMVEGSGEFPAELGAAVNSAAKLGASEISNSYGYPEALEEVCGKTECSAFEKDYEHPGALIMASAGDSGYADTYFELGALMTNFPASSPNVVAVGGTALFKVPGTARGWFEEVWNEPAIFAGTGSGCSTKSKPAWQTDSGCKHRTDNDIAAVAAVVSPVSIRIDGTWSLVGGTSVASPLVAGIEAHASAYSRSLGADAFYKDPGSLYDVTEGFDWNSFNESGDSECAPKEYLCNAGVGYDGPTGLGTPDGVPDIFEAPVVKKIAPKSGPLKGGTKVKITGSSLAGAEEVDFGSTPATEVTVNSSTSLTVIAPPASSPGRVLVSVLTKGGRSSGGRADEFSYRGKG